MTTTAAKAPLPNGIVRYEDYVAQNKVKATNNAMDQGAFLTLFTTQLKNAADATPHQRMVGTGRGIRRRPRRHTNP